MSTEEDNNVHGNLMEPSTQQSQEVCSYGCFDESSDLCQDACTVPFLPALMFFKLWDQKDDHQENNVLYFFNCWLYDAKAGNEWKEG